MLLLFLLGTSSVVVLGLSSSSSSSLYMTTTATTTTTTTVPTSRVAVVTGASRGIGRGIALELGSEGYIVYCLGRSSSSSSRNTAPPVENQRAVADGLDVTVESAAEEIRKRGGTGIPVVCDLSLDGTIESVMDRVRDEQGGRLDLLVCAAYTTPPNNLRGEFWTQPMEMWDAVNGVGLRQVYAACRVAAPLMIDTAARTTQTATNNTTEPPPPPLICLVSSFGGKSYTFNVAYGIGKAAVDRMAVDMSYQLAKYGVATTSLYPGLVKTEANLQMVVDGTWDEASGNLDLSKGESPAFSGRAVVKLASLSNDAMMKRSGNVEVVAELAKEFDFTDTDGSQPPSIRSLQYLLPNFVFPQVEKEAGKPVPDWIKNNIPDILLPWSTFSSGPPPEMDSR